MDRWMDTLPAWWEADLDSHEGTPCLRSLTSLPLSQKSWLTQLLPNTLKWRPWLQMLGSVWDVPKACHEGLEVSKAVGTECQACSECWGVLAAAAACVAGGGGKGRWRWRWGGRKRRTAGTVAHARSDGRQVARSSFWCPPCQGLLLKQRGAHLLLNCSSAPC